MLFFVGCTVPFIIRYHDLVVHGPGASYSIPCTLYVSFSAVWLSIEPSRTLCIIVITTLFYVCFIIVCTIIYGGGKYG